MKFLGKKRPKIGLALGSGAARGLTHIGVIKALTEENIPIDMLAGTSIGALIGAVYAKDGEIDFLQEIALKIDWKQLVRLVDPNLFLIRTGLIDGNNVRELLKTVIGDITFRELKIPLAVVSADINTGEEMVIKEGSVVEAVRASISIPALFTPVKSGNRFLVDGGVVNPVPVKVVSNWGADIIIAVNVNLGVSGKRVKRKKPASIKIPEQQIKSPYLKILNKRIKNLAKTNIAKVRAFNKLTNRIKNTFYKNKEDLKAPSMIESAIQSFYIMEYELTKSCMKGADIVITPEVGSINAMEFYKGRECISEGYRAAKNKMKEIKKLL